jgi:hypothetical protein
MSPLQMFLPASEPARSEALAMLQKTHRLPRHLVRGIARGAGSKRGQADAAEPQQMEQQSAPDDPVRGQLG